MKTGGLRLYGGMGMSLRIASERLAGMSVGVAVCQTVRCHIVCQSARMDEKIV